MRSLHHSNHRKNAARQRALYRCGLLLFALIPLLSACGSSREKSQSQSVSSRTRRSTDTKSGLVTKPDEPTKEAVPRQQLVLPSGIKSRLDERSRLRVADCEIEIGNRQRKRIALTFDACYDATPLPDLLEVLARYHVKSTFFIAGIWCKRYPDQLKKIAEQGHEIGNHSMTHPRFTELSEEKILAQVTQTDQLIAQILGKINSHYVRLPYGARDGRVLRILLEHDYLPVYWTVDTLDWMKREPERIEQRAVEKARNGAIILMHVGSKKMVQVLPHIIERLQAKGYELVTLTEVLEKNGQ